MMQAAFEAMSDREFAEYWEEQLRHCDAVQGRSEMAALLLEYETSRIRRGGRLAWA